MELVPLLELMLRPVLWVDRRPKRLAFCRSFQMRASLVTSFGYNFVARRDVVLGFVSEVNRRIHQSQANMSGILDKCAALEEMTKKSASSMCEVEVGLP